MKRRLPLWLRRRSTWKKGGVFFLLADFRYRQSLINLNRSHGKALEELKAELANATDKAGSDAEGKVSFGIHMKLTADTQQIAELTALHETQLKEAEEERNRLMKEMVSKLQK